MIEGLIRTTMDMVEKDSKKNREVCKENLRMITDLYISNIKDTDDLKYELNFLLESYLHLINK